MSLIELQNGWKRFGDGRIWRIAGPKWLVEVDREGNIPSYQHLTESVNKIRRVRSFYAGKIPFGILDGNGNALDLLTANAMAESLGSVPSSLGYNELRMQLDHSSLPFPGDRLDETLDYIKSKEKYLVRKEPGYVNPIITPGRVSVGAHHILISTALGLNKSKTPDKVAAIEDLIMRLPSVSVYAADLAVKFFADSFSKHQLQPPLMAAVYNAGSLRPDVSNAWNLKQYGNHVDRWIAFYNTSRLLSGTVAPVKTVPPAPEKTFEVKVVRKVYSDRTTIGEMYINEQFHCYTLEDVVRKGGVKIYGETAISAGRYKVAVSYSERFKKRMPQILDVPGFKGIRIHAGNTEKDTLGCILVGKKKEVDRISDCKAVYESLLQRMDAFPQKDLSFITIQSQNRT